MQISYNLLKLILADVQMDEVARVSVGNVAQLIHIYYLNLTSQRLIDYSNGIQGVMCAYLLSNSVDRINLCLKY